jgi:tetratricopeptide (TPR) repeat protein
MIDQNEPCCFPGGRLLVLRAVDVASAWRWRWLLSDEESGRPLADHAVDLDPGSDEVAVFGDLYEYVGVHASPDRRDEDEVRIVARAGAWAGRELLGEAVGEAIVAAAPVTVRVSVPGRLEHVLGWPLELAQVGGVLLAARGEVTLVYDVAAPDGMGKEPVGEVLRVLAVFSQPDRTSVLALRRERYALTRLIREIAAPGRAVELRVVQYGVTRQRLAGIVREAPGWDVLHLSGHGTAGAFWLEGADGSPDLVPAADLVGLLRPARRRVKLAVLSACESAAGTTARTLRLIGLDEQAQAVEAAQPDAGQPDAGQAAAGQGLDAFFRDGTSALGPDQFLAALTGWTTTALDVLPEPARLMAQFLACAEDEDRTPVIVDANWAGLWRRLERPGDPPDPGRLLALLAGAALIQPGTPAAADGDAAPLVVYRLHPGVAAAITAGAGPEFAVAADAELAAFWVQVADQAREREGGEDTRLVVRAGLTAAPYLLRRRDWDTASSLLDHAIGRDRSPGTVQAALPSLRRIAAATGAAGHQVVLARALATVDPAQAEQLMRGALETAAGTGDYRLASVTAADLANLLCGSGRLREALDMLTEKADYTRRAGLGPWTQLLDQAQRLQILSYMGEHDQVLTQTGQLREQMARLPARPAADDPAIPWNVREGILYTGYHSAGATGRWQQCLDLNADIAASRRERGAGAHERTRTRFNDAGPLIRLGRLAEAGRLLRDCQRVFEEYRDIPMLAMVLSTRAELEAALGHRDAAADLERTALRLRYAHPDPRDIAVSHHNLAICLGAGDRAGRRAHRLAAALLWQLTGMTHNLARAVHELAAELRDDPADAALPDTVADVIEVAKRTEGVHLGDLLDALEPDRQVVEEALAEILRDAAAMGDESGG